MNRNVYKTSIEMIKVNDLKVDFSYQREHLESWITKRIGDNLDLNLIGLIEVSRREDGDYVTDGWGRTTLLKRSGLGEERIACVVYHGLTVAEEAQLFIGDQDAVGHLKTGKFRASIVAGDRDAISIESVVQSRGMSVGRTGPMAIKSVDALYDIYFPPNLKGARPDILAHTLDVVLGAWGADSYARHGALLTGIGWVLAVHDGKIKQDELARKLAGYTGGATRLLADSRAIIENEVKTTLPNAVATKLIRLLNKGKKTNVLPEWRRLKKSGSRFK